MIHLLCFIVLAVADFKIEKRIIPVKRNFAKNNFFTKINIFACLDQAGYKSVIITEKRIFEVFSGRNDLLLLHAISIFLCQRKYADISEISAESIGYEQAGKQVRHD